MNYRKISVCSGIGDSIWLLQKLINAGEQFEFLLPDSKPQRGKQIFDLLPQVASSANYIPGLSYRKLLANNIHSRVSFWKDVTQTEFYLSCNEHLEHGYRIEDFFPDLKTSFLIDWDTADYVDNVLISFPSRKKYIGLYGSAYSTARAWGFWDEHKWFELARLIHRLDPEYVFVIIGAEWDLDLGRNLVQLLAEEKIPFINTIGESLGTVIEIMKQLTYFFSFPSGLGILAPTVKCKVTMFYPPHLINMMNTWASPADIESGVYKGCQFCEPETIFKWVADKKFI